MIIGLTGSMGMGKTTVSEMLRQLGIPVLCMDSLVHQLRGPGGEAVPFILKLVPDAKDEKGGINPQKLREFAFADPEHVTMLETIMRPFIWMALSDFDEEHEDTPLAVIDAPLLFEMEIDEMWCDATVTVSATAEQQMARVMARGTLTEAQARELVARQMPDEEKRTRADHVIDTSVSIEETTEQVKTLVEKLRG
jgi:dephospho-CoA kinase